MKFNFSALISSLLLASWMPSVSAENMLASNSLAPCQQNNSFSASLFDVLFTPDNNVLAFDIVGLSTLNVNVTIEVIIYAYGIKLYTRYINPCEEKWEGLCPMQAAPIVVNSTITVSSKDIGSVPGVAYTVPDLDAKVQVYFLSNDTGASLACVEAELTNGKTVDQTAVMWVTAVISGLGLAASAVTSGLGHSNTAAHVASNALALFGYFQAQAFIGMAAVPLPPIVASWTQDFQWSMGIIRVGFLQQLATWYQRATGGTPSTVLNDLTTTSVIVEKRDLSSLFKRSMDYDLYTRGINDLHVNYLNQRQTASNVSSDSSSNGSGSDDTTQLTVLKGIERVGFRANIENTNIFLTGYIWFFAFVVIVVLGVLAFKGICELLTRMGRMRGDKFKDFRNGWNTVLKGILFRIILIGFPQMVVLCFWEFTKDDSAAEIVLAVFTVFSMMFILGWAASKVIRLARRSITMHKNPAYILYSDPISLNKWGFLYVQFKAASYYFILVSLAYILVKGLFIGLAQGSGDTQAVALFVIELAWLITVSVLKPFMDKRTNAFNIAIASINFVSALFLLFFANIWNAPTVVPSVMGVVFFVVNAAFATVLLIMLLVASVIAVVAKNPDTRYQPMRDDRSSFIKSQTALNTELDALGATARGEDGHRLSKGGERIDDSDSWSGGENGPMAHNPDAKGFYGDSIEPVNPSMTQFSTNNGVTGRHDPPFVDRTLSASPYRDDYANSRTGSMNSNTQYRPNVISPYQSSSSTATSTNLHHTTGASPWQRGAGYD